METRAEKSVRTVIFIFSIPLAHIEDDDDDGEKLVPVHLPLLSLHPLRAGCMLLAWFSAGDASVGQSRIASWGYPIQRRISSVAGSGASHSAEGEEVAVHCGSLLLSSLFACLLACG